MNAHHIDLWAPKPGRTSRTVTGNLEWDGMSIRVHIGPNQRQRIGAAGLDVAADPGLVLPRHG